MTRITQSLAIMAILVASLLVANIASACPFCPQVAKTFSQEFESSDVVVIAELLKPPPPPSLDSSGSVDQAAIAKFEVSEIIKGESHTKRGATIATAYFGDGKTGETFLLMGADPQQIVWTTPLPVNDQAIKYFEDLKGLPAEGADRLAFFQKYLEHQNDMLARDAFDEFARAPYDAVKALAPQMEHDQLVTWIEDIDIPASRRRLYLTMLGTCGSEKDLPWLENMLKSDDRKVKAGLDAMIACYLTLGGEKQLPVIDELFMKNKDAEYADTYAAIMALRFHGNEDDIIPRDKLVRSFRYMLERPQLADLVIPDLAKWEDWESMDKLVTLFKTADEKSNWVRVPVINYLRQCPRPEAKKHLEELQKIDPKAFQRANTFFPGGAAAEEPPAQSSAEPETDTLIAASGATIARGQNAPLASASEPRQPGLASISRARARQADLLTLDGWQITTALIGCGLILGLAMFGLLKY